MANEIQRLRELLEVADSASQAQIDQRVDGLERGFEALPTTLPRVLRQADEQGPQLAAALEGPLHRSIEHLARKRRDLLAQALFPVLGPAIRKAITEALRQLVENLNRLLESTFTVRGMRWRLEAWRSGMPYAQVALRHLLRYSVEHLFLVQNGSGLLLARAQQTELVGRDTDAVAAMLTAIRDFSRDAGFAPEEAELSQVALGEHLLRLYPGPEAYLAAAISGVPAGELDASLAELLEQLHAEASASLAAGESTALLDARLESWLQQSEHAQALREEAAESRPWLGLFGLAVLVALLCLWVGERVWSGSAAARLEAAFNAESGYEVRVQRTGWLALRVSGLRDPLARPTAQIVSADGWGSALAFSLKPFLALDDDIVRHRLLALLDPPASVELSLREGALLLRGQADAGWIDASRERLRSWPGLTTVRLELTPIATAPPLAPAQPEPQVDLAPRVWQIGFAAGEVASTTTDAITLLDAVYAYSLETGPEQMLWIESETDGSGGVEVNRRIAEARAQWVVQELLARGVEPGRLAITAIRPRVVAHADSARRRVVISSVQRE